MPRETTAPAETQDRTRRGLTHLFLAPNLTWMLVAYAVLVLGIGWAYASLRIRSDYAQTLAAERNRVREVAAALQAGTQAMLYDGIGAAVAGAATMPETRSLDSTSLTQAAKTLAEMLTGGDYVRSLFVSAPGWYVRAGRGGFEEGGAVAPEWLSLPPHPRDGATWVGRPIVDPDHAGTRVIPAARYVARAGGGGIWAGALFGFGAFDELYARLGGDLRIIGLIASDGTVLVRAQTGSATDILPGTNVASSELFKRAIQQPYSGVVEGFSPRLGVKMMYGYEQVHGYDMTILAGQTLEAILAPWTERRLNSLILTGASSVLLVLMTALLSHYLAARRSVERNLGESEGRYRALVDALPEAVFVHRGGELLFVNEAAARLVGASSAAELVGQPVLQFVWEPDRNAVAARTRRVLEQRERTEARETRMRRLDGVLIWVEAEGVPITYNAQPAVQGVMHDVTARRERKEAEEARALRVQHQSDALLGFAAQHGTGDQEAALREVCTRARDVLGADRACVWMLRTDNTIQCMGQFGPSGLVTRGGAEFPAASVQRYLAALRSERVVAADDAREDPRTRELLEAGFVPPNTVSLVAAAIRLVGDLAGAVVFEQAHTRRSWYPDETSFVGGVGDQIAQLWLDSEREQALADLRTVTGELTRLQDEERRRIGRDLHDSTGQTLAALELGLARLMHSSASQTPDQRDLLESCARLAHQCSAEIRTASYLLHPPLLDELGLVSALRWLADGLRERSGLDVRLDLPESMARLPRDQELTLFRVAQEALTNVHRHAASPWVLIKLKVNDQSVLLQIEDAGRGIPATARAAGQGGYVIGVGLAGMRERVRQVGGSFVVEASGRGTAVQATLPRGRTDRIADVQA